MKFASLRNGSVDGALFIVTRDLRRAIPCADIAASLRDALERWESVEAALRERAERLERGPVLGDIVFDPRHAMAPLPRAPQLLDGSAFKSHGDLMGLAFGTSLPPNVYIDSPLMYQGTSDDLLGAHDDIVLPSADDGIDFEGEIVVYTAAVPMGVAVEAAQNAIRLVSIMNDVSLRALAPAEIATGFGFVQAKPRSSFAPVAVTPDELGSAWHEGRVGLPLNVEWNGAKFGAPSGSEMSFSFAELIAYAARRRTLSAGTIVGSGTISNTAYAQVGSACITERRMIEKLESGAPQTRFMQDGDRVRMELLDAAGRSVCGAIDQHIRLSA